jgi:hypothetical protein
VVVAQRVPASVRRLFVEPAARENAASSFYPHHCRACASVLDRHVTFEASFAPVVNITLAGDVVGGHAVMRQADDGFTPAAPPQLTGVVAKWLADALDIVQQPNFSSDELADPDRRGIGGAE